MALQETMVKRTLCALAAALAASAGWGLAARESPGNAPAAMAFPGVRPAPFASLLRRGTSVTVVYADRDTTSLRAVDVPVSGVLPAEAPKAVFVDKVDIVPPLGGSFGLHASAVFGGRLRLLYLDREKDDRPLLKLVTENAVGFSLALVEPFGSPVAVLAEPGGTPADVWAAGSLRMRGTAGDRVLEAACLPRGQALPIDPGREDGPPGFAFWDDASGGLRVVLAGPDGIRSFPVPDAGPVSAAAESPGRDLAVATWDPGSRRILLLERDSADGPFRRTTVTVCDGVSGLFLSWTPSGWMFLYDEVRSAPPGGWVYELSLLSPEPRSVGRPRYLRRVLSSGSGPLAGFRALRDGATLFVLEMRDGLRLLKTTAP
jgi:hypothetical protein